MQPDNLTHHTIIAEGVEPYKTTFLQLHSFRFGFSRISDLSSWHLPSVWKSTKNEFELVVFEIY